MLASIINTTNTHDLDSPPPAGGFQNAHWRQNSIQKFAPEIFATIGSFTACDGCSTNVPARLIAKAVSPASSNSAESGRTRHAPTRTLARAREPASKPERSKPRSLAPPDLQQIPDARKVSGKTMNRGPRGDESHQQFCQRFFARRSAKCSDRETDGFTNTVAMVRRRQTVAASSSTARGNKILFSRCTCRCRSFSNCSNS